MKRLIYKIIKTTVGLIPSPARSYLRKHPLLLALYSNVVYKSGFRHRAQALSSFVHGDYSNTVKHQDTLLDKVEACVYSDVTLILLCDDKAPEALLASLKSIQCLSSGFTRLFIVEPASSDIATGNMQQLIDSLPNTAVLSRGDALVQLMVKDESVYIFFAGDVLHPRCLDVLEHYKNAETEMMYSDLDHIDQGSHNYKPLLYPDWDPDLQLATGYVQSGAWFRDFSLFSTFIPRCLSPAYVTQIVSALYLSGELLNVVHIPLAIIHRKEADTFVLGHLDKGFLRELQSKADYSVPTAGKLMSVRWKSHQNPLVSLIIPTRNAKKLTQTCIDSILQRTLYNNFEIILVDNNSDCEESINYFETLKVHPKVSVLKYPYEFNYSAINNFAVGHTNGEVIGLINNDIEVISHDWLDNMVAHVMRDDIGCVGAKLLYDNGLIQHAGVVMGYGGGAGHAHKFFPRDAEGYLQRISASNCFSAVTAACLLVTKSDFHLVGGLDETNLTIAFNDVDFCLKVKELGLRNLYCAEAELYHHESISRGAEDTLAKQLRFKKEVEYIQHKWKDYIAEDPAYNCNLTLEYENFSLRH